MLGIFKALFSKNTVEPESVKPVEKQEKDAVQKPKEETAQTGQPESALKKESEGGQNIRVDNRKSDDRKSGNRRKPEESDRNSASQEKSEPSRESKKSRAPKNDPGRDLYRYLNQAVKTMHNYYSKDQFDDLSHLGRLPGKVHEEYNSILEGLSEDSAADLSALRAMVVLREEEDGTYVEIADREGLKKEFLNAMLPFYALYAKELYKGRVRFSSLIGRDLLKLFHELTGKKFSIGFHRRYESGINAFEWNQEVYQVYDEKGHLLCDADFADGKVNNGYAEIAEPDPEYEDWNIVKAGHFINGEFREGALRYVYRHPVN